MLVEASGVLVLGVDGEGGMPAMSAACSVRCIASFSRPAPRPPPLPSETHGEPGEQHDGNRMTGQPLAQPSGCVVVSHFAHRKRVVAHDRLFGKRDVSLGVPARWLVRANRTRKRFNSSLPQSNSATT